jgi:hypothetical protein
MGNFQDSRFLGLSPRAIGLGIVAVGVVVGLFFIPETVRFLFDGKPRASREKAAVSKQATQTARRGSRDDAKAALAPDALSNLNANMQRAGSEKSPEAGKAVKKTSDAEEGKGQGGLFSDWNFQVKAHPANKSSDAPVGLTLERIQTKEGISFLKRERGHLNRFVRSEGLGSTVAADDIQALQGEIDGIIAGSGKGLSVEEIRARLDQAHLKVLRGLKASGADRGTLLRWLDLPLVNFIDQKGQVRIEQKVRAAFSPVVVLSDLAVWQRAQQASLGYGASVPSFRAEFLAVGSDIERVVVYANGRVLRSIRTPRNGSKEQRPIRIQGEAQGVITVVAHDAYGARPFSKSYVLYPRVRVFRQDDQGAYQIGFLPGSARNSLDKFFLVASSGRPVRRDPVISQF